MNLNTLRLEMQGTLAVLSLCQPERGNPMNGEFTREFKFAVEQLWQQHEAGALRAVLLRADGLNFSYGGDLKAMVQQIDSLPALVRDWTGELHTALQRFWHLPVPAVAAVQGFAMGGSLALAAGCDVVVAAQSASLGSAFAQLGFSNDSGSSVVFTARLGAARARRFVMLAEVMNSAEALRTNLVDRVVADERLQADALAQAQQLAAGPTVAYGEIKRLFLEAAHTAPAAQLEDEAMTLARVAASADAREGVRAVAERRKPNFQGQ
jgi:2-(1,2-epoxy-1,2-dihydrophenyl)acetyl-CoA isomerase